MILKFGFGPVKLSGLRETGPGDKADWNIMLSNLMFNSHTCGFLDKRKRIISILVAIVVFPREKARTIRSRNTRDRTNGSAITSHESEFRWVRGSWSQTRAKCQSRSSHYSSFICRNSGRNGSREHSFCGKLTEDPFKRDPTTC